MNHDASGKTDIAGHVSKVKEEFVTLDPKLDKDENQFHIRNMGRMIESSELDMRGEMSAIYINKGRQIIHSGRLTGEYMTAEEKGAFQKELMDVIH